MPLTTGTFSRSLIEQHAAFVGLQSAVNEPAQRTPDRPTMKMPYDCIVWLSHSSQSVTAGNSPRSRSRVKQPFELGHEEDDQHVDDDRAQHEQDRRVSQGADDAAFEFVLLLGELGQPVERFFQEAAFAAGADDAGGQFAERPRVAGHGVGQRGAFLHARVDVFQHDRQVLVRRLLAQQFERTQQRHAAAEQGGKLAIRAGHDAGPHPRRRLCAGRRGHRPTTP